MGCQLVYWPGVGKKTQKGGEQQTKCTHHWRTRHDYRGVGNMAVPVRVCAFKQPRSSKQATSRPSFGGLHRKNVSTMAGDAGSAVVQVFHGVELPFEYRRLRLLSSLRRLLQPYTAICTLP